MRINLKIPSGRPEENDSIKAFAEYYVREYLSNISSGTVDIICLDINEKQGNPDFLIEPLKIAVEIKGIHDREEKEISARWSNSINYLKKHLNNNLPNDIQGTYIVETPIKAKFRKKKTSTYSSAVINAIRDSRESLFIEGFGTLKIHRISEKGTGIYFMGMGEGGIIDTPATVSHNIMNSLLKANSQLSRCKAKKRIILFVNYYIHANDENDFVEALTYGYSDLSKLKNVNEIWVQDFAVGHTLHYEVYAREFLNTFEAESTKGIKNNILLFEKWFIPLVKVSDKFKEKCFRIVRGIVKNDKLQKYFRREDVREEIVRIGEWYAKNKKYSNVIWIVEKLIDDPDPPDPQNYVGDPKFNYHELIKNGEESGIITTVLGHLAWLIRYLGAEKKYIEKALSYTRILARHKNLYVKMHALAPLIEIAARRRWLGGYGKRPYEDSYKDFHDIVFYYVNLVKRNPNYKPIAHFLLSVFTYYKDLGTNEAINILDTLKISDDSAGLFIYFGIFRKSDFRNQDVDFDSSILEKKLRYILKSNKYPDVQAKIAWHFWQILKDNREKYDVIEPYMEILFRRPYYQNTIDILQYILSDLIDEKPIECTGWYDILLNRIKRYVEAECNEDQRILVWLHDTEKIMYAIARYSPLRFIPILKKLTYLLLNWVSIGNCSNLLTLYIKISDETLRNKSKTYSQKLYGLIKKERPDIPSIEWP